MIKLICEICGESFAITPNRKDIAKFCSRKCYYISKKGKTPWNKDKKFPQFSGENHPNWKSGLREKSCLFCKKIFTVEPYFRDTQKYCSKKCCYQVRKGQHISPDTEFKKGQNTGVNNSNWKDGRFKNIGYIFIYSPKHPFARKNYVQEHRLIVEFQIKRYLLPKERVHHLNGIKDDNRPENLMAFTSDSAHQRFHFNPDIVKSEEIIFDGRLLFYGA